MNHDISGDYRFCTAISTPNVMIFEQYNTVDIITFECNCIALSGLTVSFKQKFHEVYPTSADT